MSLPDFLIHRYKDWRRNNFPNLKKLLKNNEKMVKNQRQWLYLVVTLELLLMKFLKEK